MLFTSPFFLFIFLPIAIFLYAMTPDHFKKYSLLVLGVVFYAFLNIKEPMVIVLLGVCMLYTYVAAREIRYTGKGAVLTFFVLLEILAFFAYRIFFVKTTDAGEYFFFPGASFFLLASISYMFDVYRKDTDDGTPFMNMALYISFFPVVIAGPIIKYKDFVLMMDKRSFNIEDFSSGAVLFCLGFIKKTIIAATLTETLSSFLGMLSTEVSVYSALFCALVFFFKVLFEFWGYSDMARGVALFLGYKIQPNFKNCLAACTVGDFFERFFVSLRSWLYDYIYKPFCSLLGRRRYALSVFAAVIFGALWVKTDAVMLGAGILVAACVCVEKRFPMFAAVRKKAFVGIIFRVSTVLLMSVLFFALRADNVYEITQYVKNISLSTDGAYTYFIYTAVVNLKFLFVIIVMLAIFAKPAFQRLAVRGVGKKTFLVYTLVHHILVLAVFTFAIIYFLPQFPQYFSVPFDFIAL